MASFSLSRRHSIFFFAFLGLALAQTSVVRDAQAEKDGECEHIGLTVLNNDPNELIMVCRAVSDITAYFQSIGFDLTPNGTLLFNDRSSERTFTHGYFDSKRSQIVVYRTTNMKPWGQPWTSRMAGSFLRHELVHMVIWEIVSGDPARLRPEWHEFIAYAIQFDLMDPQQRTSLLAPMAHIRPFETLLEVNEFTAHMKPSQFAIAAYKTYLGKGARKFVKQLLLGEIAPAPFSYPFPVLPAQ